MSSASSGKEQKVSKEWTPRMWQGCIFHSWIRMLAKNHFLMHPSKLYIGCNITAISTLHLGLRLLQKGLYGTIPENTPLKQPPVFIIGHINTDGAVAGPKVLEHMVDAVLQFEGDRHYSYRILRGIKNRFGSSSELGIYEMQQGGLRQVSNPSEILISQKEENMSGTAISATLEGIRPLLIETQALVTQAVYGTPQRTVSGYDLRKLQLILAVLEKRGGFHYGTKDVFLNIAGGIKIEDPAMDLAIACALLSSYEDVAISQMYAFAGEIGLSGEVRSVNRIEQRISEAEKLGFEKIFISKYNLKGIDQKKLKIELVPIAKVEDVYRILF